MKIIHLFIILIVLVSCTTKNKVSEINFNDVSSRGYSQSIEINEQNYKTVYISGQIPLDENGKTIGIGNLGEQTEQVFKNIKFQVEKAGGTMNDLVSINCFLTDMSKMEEFRKSRDKYINLNKPPTSTAVQVNGLINKDFMIEINVIAVIKQ